MESEKKKRGEVPVVRLMKEAKTPRFMCEKNRERVREKERVRESERERGGRKREVGKKRLFSLMYTLGMCGHTSKRTTDDHCSDAAT